MPQDVLDGDTGREAARAHDLAERPDIEDDEPISKALHLVPQVDRAPEARAFANLERTKAGLVEKLRLPIGSAYRFFA